MGLEGYRQNSEGEHAKYRHLLTCFQRGIRTRKKYMHIVYIHGNRSTAHAFNFIRSQITGYPETVIEYDSAIGFYRNHDKMLADLAGFDDLFFVAHSLGGIHALHLSHALGSKVVGGMTMSTPYGGSEAANMVACFLPFSRLIKDIRPCGKPIQDAENMKAPRRWTNIVTTSGASPFILQPNDGIVSVNSMRRRKDIRLIEVPCNHFEVVLNPLVVEIIRDLIIEADCHSAQAGACA